MQTHLGRGDRWLLQCQECRGTQGDRESYQDYQYRVVLEHTCLSVYENLLAADLTELLEIVHGDVVAQEVEIDVLKSTAVTVGENEAITVDELGVLWVASDELVEQDVGHRSATHRSTYTNCRAAPLDAHPLPQQNNKASPSAYQGDQSWRHGRHRRRERGRC